MVESNRRPHGVGNAPLLSFSKYASSCLNAYPAETDSDTSSPFSTSPGAKSLAQVLKCSDAPFLDFLTRCFTWDPLQRITPEQALAHPWVVENQAPALQQRSPPPAATSVSPACSSRSGRSAREHSHQHSSGSTTAAAAGRRAAAAAAAVNAQQQLQQGGDGSGAAAAKAAVPALALHKLVAGSGTSGAAGGGMPLLRTVAGVSIGPGDHLAKTLSSGLIHAHRAAGSPRFHRASQHEAEQQQPLQGGSGSSRGSALQPTLGLQQTHTTRSNAVPVAALRINQQEAGEGGGGGGDHLTTPRQASLAVKGAMFSPRHSSAVLLPPVMTQQASYLERFLPMLSSRRQPA